MEAKYRKIWGFGGKLEENMDLWRQSRGKHRAM